MKLLHELQSVQSKDMGMMRLTKSGNNADVTQSLTNLRINVSNSIRIGHIHLQ